MGSLPPTRQTKNKLIRQKIQQKHKKLKSKAALTEILGCFINWDREGGVVIISW